LKSAAGGIEHTEREVKCQNRSERHSCCMGMMGETKGRGDDADASSRSRKSYERDAIETEE